MIQESNLPKTYDPSTIESKWYPIWKDGKYFKPNPKATKKPFVIVMPPPNVTGALHMGHALDQTVQDIMIRFKRMKGHDTLWIPGQDHAGIATQAKVEQKIFKEEGKSKHDLGREEFLRRTWEWKEEFGGRILKQLETLGVSCDWDYFTFTMDEIPNRSVRKVFTDFYNEGLIYQSDYIINWDPTLQSAISDAEVEHKDINGNFYHILYQVKGSDQKLEIATTRPETLYGDTAVAVNPNDDRFKHLIGQKAIVPIVNREVPIIGDEHVDLEKGTGCLKVTPGHDFNDFEIGKRHNLETLNILNKDGTLNDIATPVQGMTVKEARKKTKEILDEANILVKVEHHVHPVGHSQRSGAVVEPMISKQWFLNTEEMAKVAVSEVEDTKNMKFYPDGWKNTYYSWLKNPKPWCISRQLWWGHQIPVFYCNDCDHSWASENDETICSKCNSDNIYQDPDVLDTWFSSGLFPLNTLGWPDEKAMKEKGFDRYYPTSTLMTGNDIIFFWVARMMMMENKITGKSPFEHVYIHAIVRDKDGIKMSKSLGNVLDPLDVIQEYGCDALRFTLAANSGYNRNIDLDPKYIEGYRNFINKLWNAFRFIHPFLETATTEEIKPDNLHAHDKWIFTEFNHVIKKMTASFEEYRFDDACSTLYQFVYEKFCSWYIELSKSILYADNDKARAHRANILKYLFKEIVKLVHPVAPYISEEIWNHLKDQTEDLLIAQHYPEYDSKLVFEEDHKNLENMIEVVTAIRNLRASVNIKPKDEIDAEFFSDDSDFASYLYSSRMYLRDLAKVKAGKIKGKNSDRPAKSIFAVTDQAEVFIPLEGVIDLDEQIKRIEKDLSKTKQEKEKFEKKLGNPKFADNAPKEVVEETREKLKIVLTKIESLEENLKSFGA